MLAMRSLYFPKSWIQTEAWVITLPLDPVAETEKQMEKNEHSYCSNQAKNDV